MWTIDTISLLVCADLPVHRLKIIFVDGLVPIATFAIIPKSCAKDIAHIEVSQSERSTSLAKSSDWHFRPA
jgi:hypothetical protein